MLARRRIIQNKIPSSEVELHDKIDAGITIAINYDGAKIVQAISLATTGLPVTDEFAQNIWDKIQGKK